jgi:NADPH:quinone reductase-like Zn-dependent oxidoreductase
VYLNVTAPFRSSEMRKVKNKKIVTGEGPAETPEELDHLKGLIEKGLVRAIIDRVYPFDQIVEAHRHVDAGHKKGNVIVKIL